MEFTELQEKDKVKAFGNFITVEQAKMEGVIPESYHSIFKDRCECGSQRIVRMLDRTPTSVMCCDPRCIIKMGYSLSYLFNKFDCKNLGDQTCKSLVNYAYKYLPDKSHIHMLTLENKYISPHLGGAAIANFQQGVYKVRSTRMTFATMVSRLGIPGFGTSSVNIFSDVESIHDLLSKIQEYGSIQSFLAHRGVFDPMKVFYLGEFIKDIAYAEMKVFGGVLPLAMIEETICITGHLSLEGEKITKNKYVELCNSIGMIGNVRLFDIRMNSAMESTQYLIADYPSTTEKYRTVLRREKEENRKIIYNSKEFLELLKSIVEQFRDRVSTETEGR